MDPVNNQDPPRKKDKKSFEVEDYEQILDDPSNEQKTSRIKSYLIILVIIAFFATLIFLLIFTIKGGFVPSRQDLKATNPENKTASSINQKLDQQNQIKKFKSVRELEDYLENNSVQSSYEFNYALDDEFMPIADEIEGGWQTDRSMAEAAPLGMGQTAPQKSTDFSQTNVQVQGVDEADIIKTDGEYIYALANKTIFMIKAYPATSANIVSTIELDDRPINIFLGEKTLAVLERTIKYPMKIIFKTSNAEQVILFLKFMTPVTKKTRVLSRIFPSKETIRIRE